VECDGVCAQREASRALHQKSRAAVAPEPREAAWLDAYLRAVGQALVRVGAARTFTRRGDPNRIADGAELSPGQGPWFEALVFVTAYQQRKPREKQQQPARIASFRHVARPSTLEQAGSFRDRTRRLVVRKSAVPIRRKPRAELPHRKRSSQLRSARDS